MELDGSSKRAHIFGLVRCQQDRSPLIKSSSKPNRRAIASSDGSSLSKSSLSKIANVFCVKKDKMKKKGKRLFEALLIVIVTVVFVLVIHIVILCVVLAAVVHVPNFKQLNSILFPFYHYNIYNLVFNCVLCICVLLFVLHIYSSM